MNDRLRFLNLGLRSILRLAGNFVVEICMEKYGMTWTKQFYHEKLWSEFFCDPPASFGLVLSLYIFQSYICKGGSLTNRYRPIFIYMMVCHCPFFVRFLPLIQPIHHHIWWDDKNTFHQSPDHTPQIPVLHCRTDVIGFCITIIYYLQT